MRVPQEPESGSHARMQRPKFMLGTLAAALLGAAVGVAHADIYRYVDESGKVHFTNVPNDSRYKLFIATNKEPDAVTTTLNNRYRPYPTADRKKYHAHVIAAARAYRAGACADPRGHLGRIRLQPAGPLAQGRERADAADARYGRRYGVDNPLDPKQNIYGGAAYLRDLLTLFGNDLQSGSGRLQRRRGRGDGVRHASRRTARPSQYVPKVLSYYKKYKTMM